MLERTTRSYFEGVFADDFKYLQSNIAEKRNTKGSKRLRQRSDDLLLEEHIMTRKTRTRRPRISALQSGYCAVCNVPYNNVEDHIQSKKHQKLIGEDANYIALNGSLNGFLQNNSIPFLNLNGIEAIGVHETSLDDFSPIHKKRNMRRTRAASVVFDRINPSPLSPTGSDITGHHLRSRRNINYMTPPLEEDSLQEKPDLTVSEEFQEPAENKEKETKGLRSTTRSLTKLVFPVPENNKEEEVWNSGRPKRACISKKRLSADERLNSSCKTYYKVEVVTPKLRSNSTTKSQESTKRHQSQSPKRDEEKEKGLIVKFKKLRNSELIQLNNEATNFLFPKKDDSSEEEDDEANTTASSADSCSNIEIEDCKTSTPNIKNEDETSMDSTGKKKKRRTHAEAFIMDNQKYYKFETPGSSHCRLRYQGSYLPLVMKSPDRPTKVDEDVEIEEPEEKKTRHIRSSKIKLSKYKFAFEQVPDDMGWYHAFQRLDNTQQTYPVFGNYLWEEIVLPYQMRSIQPLDRKACVNHYRDLLKELMAVVSVKSESSTRSPSPESVSSSSSLYDPDEDSKLSATTSSSMCSADDKSMKIAKLGARKSSRGVLTQPVVSSGKNPRKSPRQHASTLAILSDLVQQRKRRSKHKQPTEDPNQSLATIEEEHEILSTTVQEEVAPEPPPPPPQPRPPTPVPVEENDCPPNPENQTSPAKTPRKMKPKIDYHSIVRQIDDELDTAFDVDLDNYEIEMCDGNGVDFNNSRTTLDDIMGLYEENNSKETEKSCRRFFNGTPGRKPGYKKRKLNKTGWPSKTKRTSKKGTSKEKSEDENSSTVGSASVVNSEAEDCEEEDVAEPNAKQKPEATKRISRRKEVQNNRKVVRPSDQSCDVTKSRVKVLSNKLLNSDLPQPYVCVQKLDSKKLTKSVIVSPQRTTKRQRRMPGSPKSPRTLRKPRGRWYRER